MGTYLGIDIGTTTITALCFNAEERRVLRVASVPNATEVTSAEDRARGRSEWDLGAMLSLAMECGRGAVQGCGLRVDAVGVTGQMHGMALLGHDGRPVSPFIGWQDGRCLEAGPQGLSAIADLRARAGDLLAASGCTPATGYMGATLFWMTRERALPGGYKATFAADALVARLCGGAPLADPTHAASAGLLDVYTGRWNAALVDALGLPMSVLPTVVPSCSPAGALTAMAAGELGVSVGTPVAVACGDNQASFAGSVADARRTVLVNVGTGGQVSLYTERSVQVEGMDLRPYLDGRWLVVGAELCGGSSYVLLRDLFAVLAVDADRLYDRLTRLAAHVPPGADGLTCVPRFAGTRAAPEATGSICGIMPRNFTPGHLARALLEGLATEFLGLHAQMVHAGAAPAELLAGSGNGVRLNPVLRESLERAFGLPLTVPPFTEEAALGAALVAAVSIGEYEGIIAASAEALAEPTGLA